MRSINHVATGFSAVLILDTCVKIVSRLVNEDFYGKLHNLPMFQSMIQTESNIGTILGGILTITVCTAFFTLGCLLPDIDQEKSVLGKIFYVPVRHRTWTHTIWMVLLLSVGAIFVPWLWWLTCGCTLHIFFDSLSKGGICWFYPISQYKTWASGAQVKKNHWIYLYRTGETSETIVTMLVVFAGASMLTYNILLTANLVTLPSLAG